MKIYQSWYMYLSRVAINRFHLKLFLTSRLDPPDNDLCGGAPIETPGCAGGNGYATPPADCGGDTGVGRGVTNATVEDVSVAPFTYQVAFFASPTKAGVPVTTGLTIRNYRSGGTFADGINIHGAHRDVLVEGCDIALTGDDCFVRQVSAPFPLFWPL